MIFNSVTYTVELIIRVMIKLLKILEDLHSLGIVHRDIKPENIMSDSLDIENIYLIDFGLSK